MANAFTIFGEITADTSKLQKGLDEAEKRLKATRDAIEATEKEGDSLGQSNARTARSFEKLSDKVAEHERKLEAAVDAYTEGVIDAKQFAQVLNQVERATSGANSKLKDTSARLKDYAASSAQAKKATDDFKRSVEAQNQRLADMGSKMQTLGGGAVAFGAALTAGLTVPITALGYAAVNSAADLESLQMGLTAVMGSSAAAKAEMVALQEVAKLPGLGLKEAMQGSINLQAAGLSAETARGALTAFGNALATVGKGKAELDGVITALSQIQSKGKVSAEEINQIAERVPQIRKVMLEAFGTAQGQEIEKLGISTEKFIEGVIAQLGKLPPVATSAKGSFENLSDTIELALKPVGDAILPILIQGIERVTPIINNLSAAFSAMSPTMQTVTIAVGAFLAALGPIVAAIGAAVIAAGALAASIAALGGIAAIKAAMLAALPIIAKVALVVAALAAAFALVYTAYKKNFAGLGDLIDSAMARVVGVFNDAKSAVLSFWEENGDRIKLFISNLMGAIKYVIGVFEPGFRVAFTALAEVVGGVFDVVVAVVKGAWAVLSNIFMLIVNLVNGDFKGAWQNLKNIVSGAIDAVLGILGGLLRIVMSTFKGIVAGLRQILPEFAMKGLEIADSLIDGIVNALRGGWSSVWDAAKTLGTAAIAAIKKTLGVASPSKEFYQIGVDVIDGFILGLKNNENRLAIEARGVFERALLAIGERERVVDISKRAIDKVRGILDDYADWLNKTAPVIETETEKLNRLLADPEVSKRIDAQTQAVLKRVAALRDLMKVMVEMPERKMPDLEGIERGIGGGGGLPTPEEAPDETAPPGYPSPGYLDIIKKRMQELQASMPSFAESLGGALTNFITGIGDVFARAVTEWDGTAKGFFKSLASGFKQLIQQLISELMRLAVTQMVLGIAQMVGGAVMGGGYKFKGVKPSGITTAGLRGGSIGSVAGVFASGGYVRGPGTSTSDSIPAMLSNGEFVMPADAVRKFGVGFFERLRNLSMPGSMMQMAGGGMVGMPALASMGGSSSSTMNNTFNINVPPGSTPNQTASMVQSKVLQSLRRQERRNK